MLKLEVINCKGVAPSRPISAEFDKLGGGIGRGDANVLVLPDVERYISRTHAKIVFRAGIYALEDHSTSSPIMLNGRTLGKGSHAALAHGDEITIGDYTLRTILQEDVPPAASFESGSVNSVKAPKDDPMALFGAAGGVDPFADLAAPAQFSTKSTENPAPSIFADPFGVPAKAHSASIPADFDPFANLGLPSAAGSEKAGISDYPDLGFGVSLESRSLDDIFGLTPTPGSDPLSFLDPLAQSPGGAAFETSPSLDPMAAFGEKPARTPASSQRNNTPEIYGSFTPPKSFPDPAMAKPEQSPVLESPADSHDNMILSWNQDGSAAGDIKTVIIGPRRNEPPLGAIAQKPESIALRASELSPTHVPEGSEPAIGTAPAAGPVSRASVLPSTPSAAVSATLPRVPASAEQEAFVTAFLEGAGIPDFKMPSGFTPQSMRLLGEILRETVQGTLDLLLARAMIKREIRADVTMIIAKENNPLKFSPNVEAALSHLLAPQRGFMPPLEAMKDAYNDLRSHQFAFMAGMRAALAGVLLRFDPEQLEQRLTQKTVLDSLLPMNRRAKMWDLFVDLYGEISKEVEDDFHTLFGREFLRAYEAQIEKLSAHEIKSKRP